MSEQPNSPKHLKASGISQNDEPMIMFTDALAQNQTPRKKRPAPTSESDFTPEKRGKENKKERAEKAEKKKQSSKPPKKPYKYKALRVNLAFIFFALSIVMEIIVGVVLYLTCKTDITYMIGFLVSILLIIGVYWFNTFFDQLTYREKPDHSGGVTLIKRKTRRIMSDIVYFLNILLLVGWGIVFVKYQLWAQFV